MNDINEENNPPEENEPGDSVDQAVDADSDAMDADSVDTDPVDPDAVDADAVDPVEDDSEADDSADDMFADDTVADEPVADDETFVNEPMDAPYVPPAPAPAPAAAQYDRLTRDPTATFGGVLSGIAHRYGWDVSLTRLAFIVLLIVSGGTAIVAYLLSWIIIPRATHWPPPRVDVSRGRLSGRDLGIGLIALGALVVLGIGSGQAAAVLVPLALVGGGIWLLLQNPRDDQALTTATGQPAVSYYAAQPATVPGAAPGTAAAGAAVPPVNAAPMAPPVAPLPAPKRSRFRRVGFVGLFGLLGMILLALVAIPLLLVAAVFGGDIDFDGGETRAFRPTTVEDIPAAVRDDAGEIILDLTAVDFSSIELDDDPVEVEVDLDFGSIQVLLPEDVRVEVDAEGDIVGDVTVFGSSSDGFGPSRIFSDNDPQLVLELEVNVGEITVARGDTATTTTIEIN